MKEIPKERTVKANVWTAAFTLKPEHIAWIARKAAAAGLSKSEYVREAFDNLMKDDEKEAA